MNQIDKIFAAVDTILKVAETIDRNYPSIGKVQNAIGDLQFIAGEENDDWRDSCYLSAEHFDILARATDALDRIANAIEEAHRR